MRYRFSKKTLITRAVIIVALGLTIFLLLLLADHPELVEHYYSEDFYRAVCKVLHPILNLFPFSVGDVLYIIVTGYLIYAAVQFIRLLFKKEFKRLLIFISGLIIGVEACMLIFYLFWGMNYFRPSAAERLNLRDTGYTTSRLADVTCMLIDSANACKARVTAADTSQGNDAIYQTAVKAILSLSADSANFRAYSPGIKPSLLTPLLNYLGTSGYYNPFTTEAQLNYQIPYFTRPVVVCHELSHQVGFGAEDEANFAGFLAGIGSKDRLLRYSSYQLAVGECMRALRYRDTAANNELKTHISAAVRNDFKAERAYWLAYRSKLDVISSIFYDSYLKANNQPHGLDTYNQMVLLVVAWYERQLIVHG